MSAVGTLYNKLMEFLIANGAVQQESLAVQSEEIDSTDDGDESDD